MPKAAWGINQQILTMENRSMDINTKAGAIIGSVVGFANSLISIHSDLILRVVETSILALISGAMGALGSYLIVRILKIVKRGKSVKDEIK